MAKPKLFYNVNNIQGQIPQPKASTNAVKYLGSFQTLAACEHACTSRRACTAFTWHRTDFIANWATQCYGHVDNAWNPANQDGIDSGLVSDPNACKDDMDCSLNGVCMDGKCACYVQWTGNQCQKLNLLPVRPWSGRMDFDKSTGKNISSWGGAVLRDDSGLYHMWSAEMEGNCGIGAWLSNSAITHSTSHDPYGRFERQGVVFPVFSHEPCMARAPTGEFVMYFTSTIYDGQAQHGSSEYIFSNGRPPVTNGYCGECVDGSTTGDCGARNWSAPLPTYMSWTMDPSNDSSWSVPVAVPEVQLSPLIDTNLAPIIFKNGSLYGLWRNDDDRGSLHVVYAKDWKKPETYTMIGKRSHPERGVEDPFVWLDKNGHFHCLTHGDCGYHSFSMDGFTWQFADGADDECAYPYQGIRYTDGTTIDVGRRERPHLIFADDNVSPIALTTSVTGYNNDASFTLLQPIGQAQAQAQAQPKPIKNSKAGEVKSIQPLRAGPVCQPGGNQFRLVGSSAPRPFKEGGSASRVSATFSRTGVEGLVSFVDSTGNASNYNHDDFSVTLRLQGQAGAHPARTLRLASEQDTNSKRSCALMGADCHNDTHVFFLYRCSEKTLATRLGADVVTIPHFQVTNFYSLPSGKEEFINKELQLCQLDSTRGACDDKAAFTVLNTTLWDGLHTL